MGMKITIYTDGSSRGNPGPGGWAAIILTDGEVTELGGNEKVTTNNRMELMGTIEGLKHISEQSFGETISKQMTVEICTDSEYVKKGMTEWIKGWIAKGWKTSTKKDVLNKDLWEKLLHEDMRLKESGVTITWTYVRGHAGIPGNERADTIATGCADMVSMHHKDANGLQLFRGERKAYPYF
jgi:ribonuclease HI